MLRKTLVSFAALACFAAGARAVNPTPATIDVGGYVIDRVTGLPVVSANVIAGTTTNYLDWSGTGSLASAGVLQANFTTGLNSLNGDDAHTNRGSAGDPALLGTMGFSIANTNPAGNGDSLSEVDGECDFFRQSDSSFIGGILWTANLAAILGGAGLAEGASVRLSFADGSLEAAGIFFDTKDIFITTEFTNSQTAFGLDDPNNVGIQIRNPAGGAAAPGASSQDRMIINGTDTPTPFQPNFVGNTSYFIRVSPEPGSLAVLTLVGLGVLRRRNRD